MTDLFSLSATDVWHSIEEMAARRINPPQTSTNICNALARHSPTALNELRTDRRHE